MALNKILTAVIFVLFFSLFSLQVFAVELYPGVNIINFQNYSSGHFFLRNNDNHNAIIKIIPHNFSNVFNISPEYVNLTPGATTVINYSANLSKAYNLFHPGINSLGIDSYILSSKSSGGTIDSMIILTYVLKVMKPVLAKDIYVKANSFDVVVGHNSSLGVVVQNRGNDTISKVNATLVVGNSSFSSRPVMNLSQSQVKTIPLPVFLNYSTGIYDAKLFVSYDNFVFLKNVTISVINNPFKIYDFYSEIDNKTVLVMFYLKNNANKTGRYVISSGCYPYTTKKEMVLTVLGNNYKLLNYTFPIVYNYSGNVTCSLNVSNDISNYFFSFNPIINKKKNIKNKSLSEKPKPLNILLFLNMIIIISILLFVVVFFIVFFKKKSKEVKK